MESSLCLRNRTNENLWLYTEQTAPLEWVHLRPGECCDIPTVQVWYTIGASRDEPSATAAIFGQLGFAAAVLASIPLFVLPDPTGGTKAAALAIVCYVVGASATVGGLVAGSTLLGVSNKSTMKRPGVYADRRVMDITATLEHQEPMADGKLLPIYNYRWEEPPLEERQWERRHHNFTPVDIRANRGDINSLKPVSSSVLAEIRKREIASTAFDNIVNKRWSASEVRQQEALTFGGDGGRWSEISFCPEYAASHSGTGGRIVGVRVAACKFIDGIQVKFKDCAHWANPTGNEGAKASGVFHGKPDEHMGNGGTLECTGEHYINKITVKHDKYICQLTFETTDGRSLKVGGRDGDGEHETVIGGAGKAWIGFKLVGDAWVDQMTFLIESPA